MRRVLFIILIICTALIIGSKYTFAEENTEMTSQADPILPSIFIWQTFDEEENETVSDDNMYGYDYNSQDENSYGYVDDLYVANYNTVQLKGYLDYIDDRDAIGLKNTDNTMALNLRVPQKIQI